MFVKSASLALISIIISGLAACGSESDNTTTTPTTNSTTVAWADVESTIAAKCGGSTCHSSGSARVNFVGNEATTKANARTAAAYIRSTGATKMPPAGSTDLTAGERTQLLTYLDAQ